MGNCRGYDTSCVSNIINAESIRTNLNISCTNGADCSLNEIHCPDNNNNEINPKCNILCNGHDTSCFDMNVFAMNGTNNKNGVALQCDDDYPNSCNESRIHCSDDRVCDMEFNHLD